MKKRVAFVAAVLATLVGASSAVLADEKPVVRYQEYPGSAIHIVNWIMKEKGFCDKHGIVCQTVQLANGPLAQQAAAAGSVDIIVSSMDVMLQAVANGHDLLIAGTLVTNNPYFLAVRDEVAKEGEYPDNIKHLKGHKIGVSARGSGVEMYARALLSGAGVSPDDVTFVAVGSAATAYAALAADQVDAAVSWDPVPAICEATGNCSLAVDMRNNEGPDEVKAMNGGFVVWQVRRNYAEEHNDRIEAFLAAQKEATEWMRDPDNFDEVLDMTRERIKLDDSIPEKDKVLEVIARQGVAQIGNEFDPATIDGFNAFLLKNDRLDKPVDPKAIVHTTAR